jgi:hypothetical protein
MLAFPPSDLFTLPLSSFVGRKLTFAYTDFHSTGGKGNIGGGNIMPYVVRWHTCRFLRPQYCAFWAALLT